MLIKRPAVPVVSPLNDLTFLVTLTEINQTTGVPEVLTSGSVHAFLATGNAADVVAIDPSLDVVCTYVEAQKKWLVHFDAATLTLALLSAAFNASAPYGTPYVIIEASNNTRTYVTCTYSPAREAVVV